MGTPENFNFVLDGGALWLVRISCRWRSWRTGLGCTRVGFHWDAGGVVTARRRDMRVSLHRRKTCRSSATLAMRKVADVCRGIGSGIRSGLELELWATTERTVLAGASKFAMSASGIIVPPSTGCSSLMRLGIGGNSVIPTTGCRGWRSALWRPMLKSGRGRKQLRPSRVNGKLRANRLTQHRVGLMSTPS